MAASPFRLWLDLARAGNFPSIWSNVITALILSGAGAEVQLHFGWPFWAVCWTLLAGSLAYPGGTTLNDVFDTGFDRTHRPERAIPSGRISRSTAGWVGGLQLASGLGILIWLGASPVAATGLAATILSYNWLHKRWTGSVLLMAGCRVMLAVTIATLPGYTFQPVFVVWITILFVYIVVLSLLARREYLPGAPAEKLGRLVRKMLAFIPFVDTSALIFIGAWIPALATALSVPLGKWAQRQAASG